MTWQSAQLKDLVFFQRGFDITKAEQKSGSVPVISSSGITSYHDEAKVAGPGIVIGRKGTLGSVHFSAEDFWPHDTTLWSKDLRSNDPKFVYYFLKTLHLEKYNVGNANPTLNRNHIHGLDIRIPAVVTQVKIGEVLSGYDALIENNRRRIQLLEESARLLYREWFVRLRFPGHDRVRIVDDVPAGWELRNITSLAETIGGGTPDTKIGAFWDGGTIPWFTPTDLTASQSLALLGSKRHITDLGLAKSSAKLLPAHSILMSSRASIGYFGVFDKPCATNQGFISLIPHADLHRYFLLHNLLSRRDELHNLAKGTTFLEISKSAFRSISVLLPTENILEAFDEQAKRIFNMVLALSKANQKLTEARDILLPKLMSGEVQV